MLDERADDVETAEIVDDIGEFSEVGVIAHFGDMAEIAEVVGFANSAQLPSLL